MPPKKPGVKRITRSPTSSNPLIIADSIDDVFTITHTDESYNQWEVVLVAGLSGSGRTQFALSWPKPFVLNTDKGLGAFKDQHIPMITLSLTQHLHTSDVLTAFINRMRKREAPFDSFYPETLVIDQATSLCLLLEQELLEFDPPSEKGSTRKGTLFMSDYNLIQIRFTRFLNAIRDLNCNVVMITNTCFEKDSQLEGLFETPDVTGSKLGPKVPTYFSEVYYMKHDNDTDTYTAKFKPTKRFPYAKTHYDSLKNAYPDGKVENPTYDKFAKYYKGKKQTKKS